MIHAVMKRLVETAEFFINPAPPPDRGLSERVALDQPGRDKLGRRLAPFPSGIPLQEKKIGINNINGVLTVEEIKDALHGRRFVKIVGAQVGEDVPVG